MRDQSFRREMEAWARARGYSETEIEEAANISEEIMLKNARGEPLTPAEERAYEENELVRENIRRAAERVQPGVTNTADANASLASSDARSNDPLASTNARMGILAGNDSTVNSIGANPAITARLSVSAQLNNQENFAGAPSLSRSFDAANAAITPLDVRQPQLAIAAPVAPANAGLDI